MPSRKQRRRRAKAFRHEYDLVLVDADGNEMPVDPDERRVEREAKDKQRVAKAKPTGGKAARGGRAIRQPPQPTWDRALRRGGVMGALMLLAFIFLFKSAPLGIRLAWGVFYAAAFVPLTYFVDRTAYRTYLKRVDRAGAKKSSS
jgi:hypothetical protein